jgi:hypothetical protein
MCQVVDHGYFAASLYRGSEAIDDTTIYGAAVPPGSVLPQFCLPFLGA